MTRTWSPVCKDNKGILTRSVSENAINPAECMLSWSRAEVSQWTHGPAPAAAESLIFWPLCNLMKWVHVGGGGEFQSWREQSSMQPTTYSRLHFPPLHYPLVRVILHKCTEELCAERKVAVCCSTALKGNEWRNYRPIPLINVSFTQLSWVTLIRLSQRGDWVGGGDWVCSKSLRPLSFTSQQPSSGEQIPNEPHFQRASFYFLTVEPESVSSPETDPVSKGRNRVSQTKQKQNM